MQVCGKVNVCVCVNANMGVWGHNVCMFRWMSVLTSAGIVRGPVFAGHAHHL